MPAPALLTLLTLAIPSASLAGAGAGALGPAPDARAQEIARLEQQKAQLFQQLNAAIDDSVRSLAKNNDSEARVGISYIEDLREKVKALNASPSAAAGDRGIAQGAEILDPEPDDFRRSKKKKKKSLRQINLPPMKAADANLFGSAGVFGDRAKHPRKWQERYENRMLMQQKLEQWLAEREREKIEIKKYKATRGKKMENCPRFGIGGKKRKSRRQANDDKADDGYVGAPGGGAGAGARGSKYPCCRKCCKRSYLGCL